MYTQPFYTLRTQSVWMDGRIEPLANGYTSSERK